MRDVIDEFFDGPHATPPPSADGPIFLGIKNMTEDGLLDLTEVRHIAESDYPKWTRRVEPRSGDLVLTYEASLHRYAVIPDGFRGTLGRRVALLRPRLDMVDTRFLLYTFTGPEWRSTVQKRLNVGSTVDRLPLTDLPNFPLRIPDLRVQRKIAAILTTYDDLIENNNRRIKLLEEMAQRIYREWFVDYRYPGHEGVPLVDSELGRIPERWEVGRIGDHANVVRGRSYRGVDVVEDGGVPFVNLKCLERDGGFRTDGVKRYAGAFKPVHTVRVDDIVMAVTDMTQERRIVARAARIPRLNDEIGVFSMDLVKIVPSDISAEYLFGLLSYSDFADRVKAYANGANVLHLHPDRICDFRMAFAPSEIEEQYAAVISPAQDLADALQLASVNLRATRDLLLRRLISGEIDVTNLDIVLAEAAA
jgi:type I restriction enzyme S subunit